MTAAAERMDVEQSAVKVREAWTERFSGTTYMDTTRGIRLSTEDMLADLESVAIFPLDALAYRFAADVQNANRNERAEAQKNDICAWCGASGEVGHERLCPECGGCGFYR